ncbi:unnamed protein product [Orchesella dallaii]|uniref:Uncharacterized protein n=1 Tax=Orchesella dallaii TaxID=48710 RepID=A0ABP1QS56_9HEXA
MKHNIFDEFNPTMHIVIDGQSTRIILKTMISVTGGRGRKPGAPGLKSTIIGKRGPFHPMNLEHHPQKNSIGIKSAAKFLSPNPAAGRPSSRSRSRTECLENSDRQYSSLPVLNQKDTFVSRHPASISKSYHSGPSSDKDNHLDLCSTFKLPAVDHLPKLQHREGEPNEEELKGRKSRSKKLRRKIFGSSDANLLPDKYGIIKVEADGLGGLNVKLEKGSPLAHVIPDEKSNQEDNSSKRKQLVLRKKERNKLDSLKILQGKVDIRPAINKDIWSRLHAGQNRQRQPHRSKNEIFIEKPVINSITILQDGSIPPGGQMQMESRSVQQIILKPVVSPERQVIRRKSKFMENQTLKDVYSISQADQRVMAKDGNLSRSHTFRNRTISNNPTNSCVHPFHVVETSIPNYNYRPHHHFHNLSQSGGRPGIHKFHSPNSYQN